MGKYTVYSGEFKCQVCGIDVTTLRSYPEEKLLTWMCSSKHMSRVSLSVKKTKKDYEREIRD